jgi:hypothetical protein
MTTSVRTYRSHAQWAFGELARLPLAASRGERSVLLLAGTHADEALHSPSGDTAVSASAAGSLLGYATSTVEGFMRRLIARGLLERAHIQDGVALRAHIPLRVQDQVAGR